MAHMYRANLCYSGVLVAIVLAYIVANTKVSFLQDLHWGGSMRLQLFSMEW